MEGKMIKIENGIVISYDRSQYYDEVILPEGVTEIGDNALAGIACSRLVMPSTLKIVRAYGCNQAQISTIDFGECKLETIEMCGFEDCTARATLPDTLKKIAARGANLLLTSKDGKLVLPKAIRFMGTEAINLQGVSDIEVDEGSVTDECALADSLYSCVHECFSTILIHVMRDGKELYNFVLYRGESINSVYEWNFRYFFVDANGLDFDIYDDCFMDIDRVMGKIEVAVNRLLVPYALPEETKERYKKYAHSHYDMFVAGNEEDLDVIRRYGEADLISAKNLVRLLENAREKNLTEMTAYLLDLINRRKEIKAKSLKM
jgi:hypothetical protein